MLAAQVKPAPVSVGAAAGYQCWPWQEGARWLPQRYGIAGRDDCLELNPH